MSKPAPKKKEDTGIFSIEANPFDDGEIPGVTQLLTLPKKAAPGAPAKKVTTLEPTTTGQIHTLKKAAQPQALEREEVTRSSISIDIHKDDHKPAAPVASASGTKTNIVAPSTLKLKDFGVLFELRFHAEGSFFRYASAQGHKEPRLLAWQEKIFEKIRMDKKSVPAKEPFEEFRVDQNGFLFDCFAVQAHHFIAIVSPEYTNTRIVLVSEKSLAAHVAAILEHFSKG